MKYRFNIQTESQSGFYFLVTCAELSNISVHGNHASFKISDIYYHFDYSFFVAIPPRNDSLFDDGALWFDFELKSADLKSLEDELKSHGIEIIHYPVHFKRSDL